MQSLSKEPIKPGTKPPVVPSCTSANDIDNTNQNSQSIDMKNAHLHNIIKQENRLVDAQNMNDSKILTDNTFKMRLIKKIENWSPSTAKYARLSIFGCKVSIYYLCIIYLLIFT